MASHHSLQEKMEQLTTTDTGRTLCWEEVSSIDLINMISSRSKSWRKAESESYNKVLLCQATTHRPAQFPSCSVEGLLTMIFCQTRFEDAESYSDFDVLVGGVR